MSNVLFCTTDASGFQEDYSNRDGNFNYQLSSLFELNPDIYGLKSWGQKEMIPWDRYDLVWIHLNPREMFPDWYMYPKYIKKEVKDTPVVVSHEYLEKYYNDDFSFLLKRYFKYADYIQVNSRIARDIMEEEMDVSIIYKHISKPQLDILGWLDPIPWEEREGLVFIEHTIFTNLIRSFEIAREANIPVTLISSNPRRDRSWWQRYVEAYDLDAEYYGRLPFEEYIDKIRYCKVGLEAGYVGISRFSYECAKENVPVFGTDLLEYRNMLYPELTINPDNVEESAVRIRNLHDGDVPKSLNTYADFIVNNYWSSEENLRRLEEMLEEII